jgi:hypothetical protein
MSKFAATMPGNLQTLRKSDCKFIRKNKFAEMAESMSPFMLKLKKFKTQEKNREPMPEDVKSFKFVLHDDDETDQFFQKIISAHQWHIMVW